MEKPSLKTLEQENGPDITIDEKNTQDFLQPEIVQGENLLEDKKEIESLKEGLEEKFSKKRQRRSSVTRIIGKENEVSHETVLKNVEKRFYNQPFSDKWIKDPERWGSLKEREKTDEELEIIRIVDTVTSELLEKYGLEKFHIPPENVHLMKRSIGLKIYEMLAFQEKQGSFQQHNDAIRVIDPISKMALAQTVLHEMIHFKSYNALQREDTQDKLIGEYRVGLEVNSRDGKTNYFKALNEAVTEELTKRLFSRVVDHEIFKDEKKKTEALKQSSILKFLYKINQETYYVGYAGSEDFTYQDERDSLNHTIDQIWEKNQDEFKTREDVFEVFARAAMTGNILPLGRLFKKTFGKDYFRSYAKYGNLE